MSDRTNIVFIGIEYCFSYCYFRVKSPYLSIYFLLDGRKVHLSTDGWTT